MNSKASPEHDPSKYCDFKRSLAYDYDFEQAQRSILPVGQDQSGAIVDQARTCFLSVIVCVYQNEWPITQFVECDEKSRVDHVPGILNEGQGASAPTNSKRCDHAADDITPCRSVKPVTLHT
jgi:hypothetical protein